MKLPDPRILVSFALGLLGGVLGGLLVGRGAQEGPPAPGSAAISPAGRSGEDLQGALEALNSSIGALREDLHALRLRQVEPRSPLGDGQQASLSDEAGPLLIETLQHLTRALDRFTSTTRVPTHPAQNLPQRGAEEEMEVLHREMIAHSQQDVLSRFGRPSEILAQSNGSSTWTYRDDQNKVILHMDFVDGMLSRIRPGN